MVQGIGQFRPDPFKGFDVEFSTPLEGVKRSQKITGLVPLDGMSTLEDQQGPSFGQVLQDALKSVEAEKAKAESLSLDFATGKPVDIHQMMIQVAKSDVMMQVTSAVVSKSATSLNQLLQTQV